MAERSGNGSTESTTPGSFPAALPGQRPRSYHEASPEETLAEVQASVTAMQHSLNALVAKIDAQDRLAAETKNMLRQLEPKIEDLNGFAKHRVPTLTDKADLTKAVADLRAEIEKRPTRRQSVVDLGLLVALVGGLLAIGSHLAK